MLREFWDLVIELDRSESVWWSWSD